jgi:hypothetical protein
MQCRQKTLNAVKRKRDQQTGEGNAEGTVAQEPVFEFTLVSRNPNRTSAKLRRTSLQSVYEVKHNFGEYRDLLEVGERVDDLFEAMVEPMLNEVDEDDYVSVEVQHKDIQNPIYMSYRKKLAFEKQQFVNSVYAVSQSNRYVLIESIPVQIKQFIHSFIQQNLSHGRPADCRSQCSEELKGGKADEEKRRSQKNR